METARHRGWELVERAEGWTILKEPAFGFGLEPWRWFAELDEAIEWIAETEDEAEAQAAMIEELEADYEPTPAARQTREAMEQLTGMVEKPMMAEYRGWKIKNMQPGLWFIHTPEGKLKLQARNLDEAKAMIDELDL